MNLLYNVKILHFLIIFSLCINIVYGQEVKNDTKVVSIATSAGEDSLKVREQLEDLVDYKAQKITNDFPKRMTYLLKEASVKYQDVDITADFIAINWNTNVVQAYSKMDSLGKVLEKATFTQAGKEYKYESFSYNFKTQQGLVFQARTEEGEMVIDAEKSKRINDSIYYLKKAIATSDEYYKADKDSLPDYHIAITKGKLINNNALIAGTSELFIEQIPTPLIIPFLYIPLKGERSAGLIIPSFGERDNLGFFLQGLGFYTPIGQYFDFEVLADVYSKGSLGLHAKSSYKKNYKFNGNFSLDIERQIQGIKGLSTFSKTRNFRLNWTHNQDRKANPNLIYRANINFTSSKYFRESINNLNIYNGNFLNNTSNSSVSLDKYFDNFPMNFSLNASLNQNFNTNLANMTLPQLTGSLKRQYPFKYKSKFDLFKNLNFDYRLNAQNQMSSTTDELFSSETFKDAQNGMKHQIGLATGTTLFNYFPVNFSANYNEVWSLKTIRKSYDATAEEVVSTTQNGFSTYRTYNFSTGTNTTLYGTAQFKKDAMVQAVRLTVQPQVGYSITPDFSTDRYNYYQYYTDADGNQKQYSIFEGGVFGSPGSSYQSSVSFGLNNNLEMKVRNRTDSTDYRKIKIFDYLSINSSYNLAADSLKMSNISVSGSTSIWDSKFKINFSSSINPYKIQFEEGETTGTTVDQFGHFSVSNYNINLNFTLDNEFFGKKKDFSEKYKTKGRIRYEEYYFDEENYAKFNIPWSMNVGVVYSHSKGNNLEATDNASIRLSGKITPSPYWEISATTNYDLVTQELAYTKLSFSRDLRSFSINFNWVPFGTYKTWDFFIGIKASILRDALKYDEREYRNSNSAF